jgi:cation diffusion facilitator family transporter
MVVVVCPSHAEAVLAIFLYLCGCIARLPVFPLAFEKCPGGEILSDGLDDLLCEEECVAHRLLLIDKAPRARLPQLDSVQIAFDCLWVCINRLHGVATSAFDNPEGDLFFCGETAAAQEAIRGALYFAMQPSDHQEVGNALYSDCGAYGLIGIVLDNDSRKLCPWVVKDAIGGCGRFRDEATAGKLRLLIGIAADDEMVEPVKEAGAALCGESFLQLHEHWIALTILCQQIYQDFLRLWVAFPLKRGFCHRSPLIFMRCCIRSQENCQKSRLRSIAILGIHFVMTQFPQQLTPPTSVPRARAERKRHLIRSTSIGVAIRLLIIIAELCGVFFFGSAALLMDALSSLVDICCSLCLLVFVLLAERPPDTNHPFGHGRYEPLAGLQLGLLLLFVGSGMFIQNLWQLGTAPEIALDSKAWMIPFAAILLLEVAYAIAMRTARKHHSAALAADAAHYRVDSITSFVATVALLLGAYLPSWSWMIDRSGAVVIALFMAGMGAYAMRDNFHQLMDRTPSRRFFETVRRAARCVRGVLSTEKIRIQLYGPDAHVDIDIEVDPLLSVEKAHRITQEVRAAIQREWPAVRDVTVHVEPYYPNDH